MLTSQFAKTKVLYRRPRAHRLRHFALRSITILFAAGALQGLPAHAEFHTAAEILDALSRGQDFGKPAHLHGIVTYASDGGMSLQDSTAGIWVYWDNKKQFSHGDVVDVDGTAAAGRFSPVVRASSVRIVGHGPLPVPKVVSFRELSSGDDDAQYVSVTGIVRSIGTHAYESPSERVWMRIGLPDGVVDASLPETDLAAVSGLIDSVVRFRAPALCTKNKNGQITAPILAGTSVRDVEVLKRPQQGLFDRQIVPIGRLLQYRSGTNFFDRVRVAGTVTYYKPGERLILEQNGMALLVLTPEVAPIQPGDSIEAAGFPAPTDSGPILQDAILRRIGAGSEVSPQPVSIADILRGNYRYTLVSVDGRLLRRVDEPERTLLLLQNDSKLLVAELDEPDRNTALRGLRDGSTIRVAGISMLDVQGTWDYGIAGSSTVQSKLVLRSDHDILLLQPPSWWTTRHVVLLAATLASILVLLLVVVAYNRRVERLKHVVVLKERERLAHEIHDTLAQSFAGIGFQLQAIRNAIPVGLPHLQRQVEIARDLVRHSHKEARRSVEPLRPESAANVDLASELETSARKIVEGGPVAVTVEIAGTPRILPSAIAIALLRIGQEAIANAIQHADPHNLRIVLQYESRTVQLTVADDGRGFIKSGDLLGFGLRGMRNRAAGISATFEVSSEPGAGTQVHVTAPLPPRNGLEVLRDVFRLNQEPNPHAKIHQSVHPNPDC